MHQLIKKFRPFLSAFVLVTLLILIPVSAHSSQWPGVSITFDDGYSSLEIARPLLKQYNIVGTAFPIVAYIGTSGAVTWSDLQGLLADGWEIGSHTMTHPDLTTVSDSQLDYELSMSKQILQTTLNTTIYTLALPGGDGANDQRVLSACAKYYHFVRNVIWDFNHLPPSPYHINAYEAYNFTDPSTVIQWIESARAQGYWLVVTFHRINQGDSNPNDEYSYGTNQLTQILQYIKNNAYPTPTISAVFRQFPPVANAGANKTVTLGSTVTLDGSKSSDPCAQTPLSFTWTFQSKPAGSNASLTGANTVNPSFIPDVAGSYVMQLVVTNTMGVASQAATVTISTSTPSNSPPVANAGTAQTVHVGTTVILDGSKSYDPDGDPITFAWSFTSEPTGSIATLSDPTIVNPSFMADLAGNYVLKLIVTDSHGAASSPSSVTISTQNSAPVANAGPAQKVPQGTLVTLDGSGSSDPDGDTFTYAWSFISKPTGSTAVLTNATYVNPTFTVDKDGSYVVQLIVTDSWGAASAPATVTISTQNSPPVANAEPAQTVTQGATVTLDGSGSSDPDGDAITYAWSFTSKPTGSTATLSDATVVHPTFTADQAGNYVVQLIVTDSHGAASNPATVTITAGTPAPVVIDSYSETNRDDYGELNNNMRGWGQAFTGNGSSVTTAKFYLQKSGSPTGSAYAKIYAITGTFGTNAMPTGTALATSDAVDVSTIPTSWNLVQFNFSTPFKTTNGTHYVVTVEYTGGTASNYVSVGGDVSSPTHPGNLSYNWTGSWAALNYDLCFYVLGSQ